MAFQKGRTKTGGRKPGSRNKSTSVEETCAANGLDVFEALCEIAKSAFDPSLRFSALKELAGYIKPKLKALEVKMEAQDGLEDLSLEELIKIAKKEMNECRQASDH